MILDDRFDRDLGTWLAAESSLSAPAGLHAEAIEHARARRQRPGWLVAVRGGTLAAPGLAIPSRRTVSVLVLLGLLLVAGLAAIGLGALKARPAPLGANGLIAYSYQGYDHSGGGTRLVGADASRDRPSPLGGCIRFSQDGRLIISPNYDGSLSDVRVLDMATATEHRVPTPSLGSPWHPQADPFVLSPDGTRLAWLKDIDPASEGPHRLELWVSPIEAGSARRVVPAAADGSELLGPPFWSPDGRRIAYESYTTDTSTGRGFRSAVSVVDLESGAVHVISTRPSLVEPGLAWSPDGSSIVYAGVRDGVPIPPTRDGDPPEVQSPSDLFVIGTDGTGERNLTDSPASEHQPAWAPDGERLGYLTSAGADVEAWLTTMAMDGSTPAGPAVLGPPTLFVVWSPDATQLLSLTAGTVGARTGTVIRLIDRDLARSSPPIASIPGTVLCPPSWQRTDP